MKLYQPLECFMEQVPIYRETPSLVSLVDTHKDVLVSMVKLLKKQQTVSDVFVANYDDETFPQLIAVNQTGAKLAHIKLSEVVLKDQNQALIYLDSPEFLDASENTH
tara:strand:- start:28306 stop:28626 length:321 start_codon:yes stop_codon:yes gene_type:complete